MPCTLSVAIVTYQVDQHLLGQTLDSLNVAVGVAQDEDTLSDCLLTIVDNGDERILIRQLIDSLNLDRCRLELVVNGSNLGFGAAHNIPIQSSIADYHLILNPDVILAPSSLDTGLSYLQENTDVTLVTPSATDGDGTPLSLCKRYPSLLTLGVRGFMPDSLRVLWRTRLARYEYQDLSDTEATRGIKIASGCFMLCRRRPLQSIGGFNERYFLYFEDFELSLKLGREGPITHLPQMQIVHHGGHTARKGLNHILLFIRSAIRFFGNNGWSFLR